MSPLRGSRPRRPVPDRRFLLMFPSQATPWHDAGRPWDRYERSFPWRGRHGAPLGGGWKTIPRKSSRIEPLNRSRRVRRPGLHGGGPVPSLGDARLGRFMETRPRTQEPSRNPLHYYQRPETNMFISAKSGRQFQDLQGGQHFVLEVLVMGIQRMNVLGRTTALATSDSGQHRLDYFFPQAQQSRQRADARAAHPVGTRAAEPVQDARELPKACGWQIRATAE